MDNHELAMMTKALGIMSDLIGRHYASSALSEENQSSIRILDNDFSGDTQGGETVPPTKLIYTDGTFRKRNKSGLIEHRFMFKGKQIPVYGYSEEECFQKRYNKEIILNTKPLIIEKPENVVLTYKKWSEIWLKEKKSSCKLGYYNSIKMYLKNDILPKLGKMLLGELEPDNIQSFLEKIGSDNKRTKIAAILSESLRRAYEKRQVPLNPFIGVKFKAYESPHKSALTHKQQLLLLDKITDKKMYALTKLLILTGMRQGEALALTAEDIKEDKIRVTKSWNKYTRTATKPKTKSSVRSIPINESIKDLLAPYIITTGRLFAYDNDKLSKEYSSLLKSLDIKATGHTLRHTFATNCYEIGIPPHIVQRWMGHAKAEQIDTYLDLRNSKDFIKTDIVNYMLELKDKYVPKF